MTIINGTLTELMPTNRQKSFYGKAQVCSYPDGSKTLYSYNTPILRINADNSLVKLWDGYSATTMKHINSFCDTYGINGGGKKWWDNL